MIKLNPNNNAVPVEALRESGLPGCQRAFFKVQDLDNGCEVLIIDGEKKPFDIALKNMLSTSAAAVISVLESEQPDWESIGIPAAVRVRSVACPAEHPDEGVELSPMVEDRPKAVERDAERARAVAGLKASALNNENAEADPGGRPVDAGGGAPGVPESA